MLPEILGKVTRNRHWTHFSNPGVLVPGSVMPHYPQLLTERLNDGEQAVTWQERIDALNKSKALGWACYLNPFSIVTVDYGWSPGTTGNAGS
jgi:hypothetical protein